MTNCNWPIGPNQSLSFGVYEQNRNWYSVPGLYVFARPSGDRWQAIYVGQADDFAARLPNHERLPEAVRLGVTQIHARVVHSKTERDRLEQALIRWLQPTLNTQHRKMA